MDIESEFFGAVDAGSTWSLQIYANVPEPAEWSLMTLGIGLLGAGLRRRRATAALSNAAPVVEVAR